MEAVIKNRHQSMYGVSLTLAPLLLAISSIFWINAEYGVVGGTILALSRVFWMATLVFLFGLLKDRIPNPRVVAFLVIQEGSHFP